MSFTDNLIAYRILALLVMPFKDSKAYKYGVIDEKGKRLKDVADLKTMEEKDSYDTLHRLVFNLKRLLIKLPGGDSKLKNLASAYFLVRENQDMEEYTMEGLQEQLVELIESDTTLVNETIEIINYLESLSEDAGAGVAFTTNAGSYTSMGSIAPNHSGEGVATDEPKIDKKKLKKKKKGSIIIP